MINTFTESIKLYSKKYPLLFMVLLVGAFFRIFHYIDNRSLWEDEVFLASSLIRMNFSDLASLPLDYQQRAPLGFLWVVRLFVVIFGKKEMALRLFPLLCGLISMILFIPVAGYFLKTRTARFAGLMIVALAPPLIYHSVEVKQYGAEFLASVLALFFYAKYMENQSVRNLIWWGLGGAVLLWFSFSALFILFGMAGAIALPHLIRREWKTLLLYMIPFSMWVVSFLIVYVLFISRYPDEEWLKQFWRNRGAFMPFPPKSLSDALWPLNQIYSLIRYPMGLSWFDLDYNHNYSQALRILTRMPFIPIAVGLLGLRELWLRERQLWLLFGFPVLFALFASSLELYPLRERLTVFLAPVFILVIAKGIDALHQFRLSGAVLRVVVVLLVGAPLVNSMMQVYDTDLFGDYKKSRQREAMQFVESQYKDGDVVYVYWNNLPSYRYYEQAYGFKLKTIYGSDVRLKSTNFDSYFKNLQPDFNKIAGNQRLWYLYKPYNGIKIGDIENEPAWYYKNVDAVANMYAEIVALGKVKTIYPEVETPTEVAPTDVAPTDVKVALLELKQ